MSDYETSKNAHLLPIEEIASKLNIAKESLELYGKYKAKITSIPNKGKEGKLILVTSTSPTPYGEGKTTLSIGIADSLCKIGKNAVVVLREPSLGPVFGIKGGATGGGQSQVVPMDDINLHFTGDIHAITSANNLIAAAIDNHIFQGNDLNIDINQIIFQRCLDLNDRALREVKLPITNRTDTFTISVASEIMAILCLANSIEDLKQKLGNILLGYSKEKKEIHVKDLKIEGALTILLKDAIKPNLVQTLENNPAIIHGGPFANIAHGCNSVIATKTAMHVADYTITEAGFGSDLGAFKFLDIKCRKTNLNPDLIVINTTIRSLKYNGNDKLEEGIKNLEYHIENMKTFKENILVVLNRFKDDKDEEIKFIENFCKQKNVPFEISNCYEKGSNGGTNLANKIVTLTEKPKKQIHFPYDLKDNIYTKIEKVCKNNYYAKEVVYKDKAKEKLEKLKNTEYEKYPICIAKTQYSITDNAKKLGFPKNHTMQITDIKIQKGAGFITILMGNIMTMPGLSKTPNYLSMDIVNGNIKGLF